MNNYDHLKNRSMKWSFKIRSVNSVLTREFAEDYFFSGESHDFWELVYVERGKLTVAEDESVYELGEGQIIFHAPMEFHRFWSKKSENAIFRIISFSLEVNFEHNLDKGVFTLGAELREQFFDTFTHVLNNHYVASSDGDGADDNPIEKTLAIKKLEAFLLYVLSDVRPVERLDFSQAAKRYREVVCFMEDNRFHSLSLEDIANEMHMSQSYIKKLFMTYAGCGAMRYFMHLKIVSSLVFLRRGDTVREISEMFCFSSPNYYSTVFKREMGMLPTEYRNKEAKNRIK